MIERKLRVFEKFLTIWVIFCIVAGIALGKGAPNVSKYLDELSITINEAPVVSIPIAICLFFMMYPIMVKIDFKEVMKAGKTIKPVGLTLFANWAIKPFTMYAIALFFLGFLFKDSIGAHAYDFIKLPPGADWDIGSRHGAGIVVLHHNGKMLLVPLWRSYLAGYYSRKWIIATKGKIWFDERFLHLLTPVSIIALLVTLILLFSFKGELILTQPITILWIAIPLFIQTNFIFWITYGLAKTMKLTYEDAAPSAMIGGCIFCSYGTVPCPSIQKQGKCC
jgi:ACR3 family arsenite transporter